MAISYRYTLGVYFIGPLRGKKAPDWELPFKTKAEMKTEAMDMLKDPTVLQVVMYDRVKDTSEVLVL